MAEHLGLSCACEGDMTTYICPICGAKLRRHRGNDTGWRWHYHCTDEGDHFRKRHYATRCNFTMVNKEDVNGE